MNVQQVAAFNNASGVTSNELLTTIVTVFFIVGIFWAVIMLLGVLKNLIKEPDINIQHLIMIVLRVLAVIVICLFLVNV